MVGKTLKQYRIEDTLGQGGMGVVYRAQDTKLRRPVALKVLSAELTSDPERRRRFLLEARSAARLTHPCIAQVYDVDEENGVTFIAMELVEGRTVTQLIHAKELDLLGAIDVAMQVANGLAKAHEAGIVHRDIKPDNVIINRDGIAKILDFGLAKLLDSGSASGDDDAVSDMQTLAETQAGMVMGTVAYMSPEQARGREIDHRSDIFSLGVMIYEMGTGQLPFRGNNPLDTMHAIAFEETLPMTAIRRNLPPDLQRIVSRCLRKRPEDRFADAAALSQELEILKRDTESGKVRALSVRDRFRDGMDSLKGLQPADYLWYLAGITGIALILYLFVYSQADVGGLFLLGILLLFIYRSIRNRPQKMLQRFVRRSSRIPEVQIIVAQDRRVTVFVEQPNSALYQRINGLLNASNKKLFFGEPLTAAIRHAATEEEMGQVLSQPGVQYVREGLITGEGPEVARG